MGTIDKTIHTLSCAACGIQESAAVLDKGSNWGGSHWQSGATFGKFIVTWTGGGKEEPTITSASCRACGGEARSTSEYGG